ncbi:MAG: UDP-N-acetylglucosamine 1-carboxyvinyltransferase [Bacilli bacterium]|jgi:UDP-N-acetylglucosamine 1-carboxyvinyltransferase|nr:UDP-N-acetylglucosamine 1-carboxyvinyltransferase [Bacilli bacterium]
MQQLEIIGGQPLTGKIKIGGAKNSVVAIVPATILADAPVTITNVPKISDIEALGEILTFLGAKIERTNNTIIVDPTGIINQEIPEGIAKKLRASYYFMGALLGKYKRAEVYFPGGCPIGPRPIDLHLKGFKKLGATVKADHNKYIIDAKELIGNTIYLDIASVGATVNIMLAAVRAKGLTVIENAAKEPEIVNIATFLNNMGAKISGAGTSVIKIMGVNQLNGGFHEVIPDRIEAGTYLIIGALLGHNMRIENIIPLHLESLISKLSEAGVKVKVGRDYLIINKAKCLKSINIKTLVYPGFPTDLQQPLATLLTQCQGISTIEETIYEDRFNNIPYLNKMGADIKINQTKATIKGPTNLKGAKVKATDLRAGASLIIGGLIAEGKTTVTDINHVLRGYEQIVEKLTKLGAKIRIN